MCFVRRGILPGACRLLISVVDVLLNIRWYYSLAAYSLQQLGLLNATDIIGGYKAWKDAGLPVEIKPPRERSIASAAGSIV